MRPLKTEYMKHILHKIRILNLSILLFGIIIVKLGFAQTLPSKCYDNQSDYSFMWWMKTIKTGNMIFAIKTSHYALSFDYHNLALTNFIINKTEGSEEMALRETNEQSFSQMNVCQLNFGIDQNGTMNWCKTTSGNIDDCQLIETGKYFQRRFINKLADLTGCDIYNSGLEISSWPDRLAFILRATPSTDLHNRGLEIDLSLPEAYHVLLENGEVKALKNPADGSGFIILKSANSTSMAVTGTTIKVRLDKSVSWASGKEINTGMIIYPVATNIENKLAEIAELENHPVKVTAEQLTPSTKTLEVNYDKDLGWHHIALRNDGIVKGDAESNNKRIEQVKLVFENPSFSDKNVRLNFAKGRLSAGGSSVFSITGISAVLRDMEGSPVGIPIQLSKNWHTSTKVDASNQYFRGPWYHGLSMLTIPAKTTITLEYTSANALWGGIPAASHAQLCLVGWGANQQWDESAIGSWGESITYEPDLDQAGAPVLDYRPLMLKNMADQKWVWTGNMGGADFFNYTKSTGNRSWHSRMRTQYKRYSPNLTEVTYAGTMDDNSMDFEYTASLGRSDDLTRGIYRIKLNVLKNTTFNDFVFFQVAAPTYHYTLSNILAWGNETGLKNQWTSTIGGASRYTSAKQVADGKMQWFSFSDSQFSSTSKDFRPANRGFVIRSWKARINGKNNIPPSFAEFNATGGHGSSSGLINITPPTGCFSFQAGDFIDASIELFQVPKNEGDYYGPNQNLITALSKKTNSWEMVFREAMGNNLDIEVTSGGKLIANYPIKIESDAKFISFSVTGGKGYVPLTITNVSSYHNPELYQKINGLWVKVNQEVYGNDFWQTEYNVTNGKWDISFNINLDAQNDIRQKVEFAFGDPNLTSSNIQIQQKLPIH